MDNEWKRTGFITGLKGYETLKVLLIHIIICFYPVIYYGTGNPMYPCIKRSNFELLIGKTPLFSFVNGSFAVYMFWVISGLCIALKVSRIEQNGFKYLMKDLLSRLIYFGITVAISLLFSYLILYFSFNYNEIVGTKLQNGSLTGYLYPDGPGGIVSLIKDYVKIFIFGSSYYHVVLWFMKYAFWGSIVSYLFSYAVLKYIENVKIRFCFCCAAVILLIFARKYELATFLIGILVVLAGNLRVRINVGGYLRFGLFLIGMVLAGYPIVEDTNKGFYQFFPDRNYKLYYIVASGALIFAVMNAEKVKRLLQNRFFEYLGKYSYGIYLTHFPIMMSLSLWLFNVLYYELFLQYDVSVFLVSFLSMIVILVVGKVADECVFKPCKDMIRKIVMSIKF